MSSSIIFTISPRTSFQPNLKSPLISNSKFRAGPIKATNTRSTSFYELLGIPENETVPEMKQAYKKLARKYHPDVSPPDRVEENTQRFIQVKEAYQTLSNPRSRALYDRDHRRWDERVARERTWRSQLMELQRRNLYRDFTREDVTWGTRIRRRNESPIRL